MNEEWREILFPSGRYEVSSLGNVRGLHIRGNCKRKNPVTLSPQSVGGKPSVDLYMGTGHRNRLRRPISHLVLEAFVGPRPEGMQCRVELSTIWTNR